MTSPSTFEVLIFRHVTSLVNTRIGFNWLCFSNTYAAGTLMVYNVQKKTKAWTALADGAGMWRFSETVSS